MLRGACQGQNSGRLAELGERSRGAQRSSRESDQRGLISHCEDSAIYSGVFTLLAFEQRTEALIPGFEK